jgi:hypothetical protein
MSEFFMLVKPKKRILRSLKTVPSNVEVFSQ